MEILRKRITIIPNEETDKFLEEAGQISPDRKDIDYFALALKMKCALWSNDGDLKTKQNVITVYSTKDMMKLVQTVK